MKWVQQIRLLIIVNCDLRFNLKYEYRPLKLSKPVQAFKLISEWDFEITCFVHAQKTAELLHGFIFFRCLDSRNISGFSQAVAAQPGFVLVLASSI